MQRWGWSLQVPQKVFVSRRWPPGPRTLQTLQSRRTVPVSGKWFPRKRSRVWSRCRRWWWVVVDRWSWHKANTNSLLNSLWESFLRASVCVEYSIYAFTMTTSTIQKTAPLTDWLPDKLIVGHPLVKAIYYQHVLVVHVHSQWLCFWWRSCESVSENM